jgi:hypothetical protein
MPQCIVVDRRPTKIPNVNMLLCNLQLSVISGLGTKPKKATNLNLFGRVIEINYSSIPALQWRSTVCSIQTYLNKNSVPK